MKRKLVIAVFGFSARLIAHGGEAPMLTVQPKDFVDVAETVPGIVIKLAYATDQNVFHRKFYAENRCFLRRATAEKLRAVQAELQQEGLGLEVLDGYRPFSVQEEFWKAKPDRRYVAPPSQGSRHNRGAAVDVTLVDARGKEIPMPTAFDDFSEKAGAEATDLPADALANREKLQHAMTHHGFLILQSEWWHFDDANWKAFPVLNVPISELAKIAAGKTPESDGEAKPASPQAPVEKVVDPSPKTAPRDVDERVKALEERVETLERRVRELEKTQKP